MGDKILIIDDDVRNIFALTATLKSAGYECVSANSAAQGMALLANDPDIHVVLMDMMMPDMDGYEAMPKMRLQHDVFIVAVTAQAMAGDREKCLAAGADEYVSKPINVDILFELLNKQLGGDNGYIGKR